MDDGKLQEVFVNWHSAGLVYGGSKVMAAYLKWKNHIEATPNAESYLLLGDLILAVRKDLGLSNKGMDRETFTSLYLKNSALFSEMIKENPNVTFEEMAEEEARRLIELST